MGRCRQGTTAVRAVLWSAVCAALLLTGGCTRGGDLDPPSASSAPSSMQPSSTSSSISPVRSVPTDELATSARWVERGGRRSLRVVPGPGQRGRGDEATIAAAWAEVVRHRPDADVPGMRDQYACHVLFAPAKEAFYLEPWRPAVGPVRTAAEGCNPGERKDLG